MTSAVARLSGRLGGHGRGGRQAAPPVVACRLAVPEDAAAVAEVARAAFTGYLGHYHADPRLDSVAADAAYVEWAETATLSSSPTVPVLLAETSGQVVGFLALRTNGSAEMEMVLNAVDPAYQGQGVYRTLVGQALALAELRGCSRMLTSTQINNYAVQRVWAKYGFVHVRSFYTLHKWFVEREATTSS